MGVRRLIHEILPKTIAEQRVEDSALCQLALVGANHLVEVALGQLLRSFAEQELERFSAESLEKATYFEMLTQWLPKMAGKSLDLKAQPFLSSEALRKRRNETVHKSSALATAPMARSALFSAVAACRSIYEHSGQEFPYAEALEEHPIPQEEWFSNVQMPLAI